MGIVCRTLVWPKLPFLFQSYSHPWQLVPVALAALDEVGLLLAQLALEPFGHVADLAADRGRVQFRAQGQDLGQQLHGQPVRHAANLASR